MSKITEFDIIDSVLNVKASGSIMQDAINDLQLPPGKNIAELINDQEKEHNTTD